MSEVSKPHLFVSDVHTAQTYTTPPSGGSGDELPPRQRNAHGNSLLHSLSDIWHSHAEDVRIRTDQGIPVKDGEYLTFKSAANDSLKIESLDSSGAVLLNVSIEKETNQQTATLYIPENQKGKLTKKVEDYIALEKNGKPVNQPLVDKIEVVTRSSIENLWSSPIETLPREAPVWCELWLAVESVDIETSVPELKQICEFFGIEILDEILSFPQRCIVIVKADYAQLYELVASFGLIAEIRKTEELNSFWLNQNMTENNAWIQEALRLTNFTRTNNFISIMDSGVNNGPHLIAPALNDANRLTVDPNWGVNDSLGHGTNMAGVALYGNLNAILENNSALSIHHQLESIKILDPDYPNERNKFPLITLDAVNRAIVNNPENKRIFCMAVTTDFQVEFGKPSAYSSVLDRIIFGEDSNDKKIFLVSAGNVREEFNWRNYPESNLNLSVESPAQAWNAISVGGYTEKTLPDNVTVAKKFELSPYSRTSCSWDANWPIKPEVVFEAGNLILLDNGDVEGHDDLDILTVTRSDVRNYFTTMNATSAATALAANFLAKIRDVYPEAWEETLRALMIHSSSWTQEMIDQFNIDVNKVSDVLRLLRTVGYGVPNLQKAIECQSNYLTFISEEKITPYKLEDGKVKTNQIHYYEFPWPKEILENLGATDVTLKVTLSYFVEPNPGDRGYTTKYAYQSTALKFGLINPGEDFDNFKLRTNKVNQDILKENLGVDRLEDGLIEKATGSSRWALGADTVFKGSVHSNYWKGSAAEIASCNKLAVFPMASGWWKELKKQEKYNSELRYSLIVSIETPENVADIYTTVAAQVAVQNEVQIILDLS
ncbi:S8 family peptidase [Flavobacterium zhairuonense]|uniref:S8 family peptidase n=1 Tax=Flavobacterium zhairuonense TaxID=2493631 RepID=UPI00104F021B|nr:S8 family peptidase [Flavobacterium zhairuonense]KAF2508722.1 S8 family peptidase [Flavobacterium zhairuonense]